ncbi:hypothetical protein K450DRAFT_225590 [Umbelopsis ramanniana AG]|uniref:Nitrogen regulatory protein areA GATA-like domain-containing protein n=1 Tax=Umbelopsis ramanniana AG TaxID=1314678 RepID=A0AAD5HHC5_UMBRA|nr:uncharacterized protein K450DRAFT_225590 [Umbelopsis ramanniana AG]KAI8582944.1 hypothetical protein K450DRAFT_225590 [Umbelopsis ramanniana AG]
MPVHQPMLAIAKHNFGDLEMIDADNISGMWAVFTKCKANIEHGTRLENMSWRLWYRETANHHEVNKDYFSFLPPRSNHDDLHTIGSSEPSPALSTSSTLTTTSSVRSARQFSPVSFIRFISSLSPDHSLKDLLKEQKLKMEATGINLSKKTELEITEAVSTPLRHRDVEKKDKGRDKGEHEILNANTYHQEVTQQIPSVITSAADKPTSRHNGLSSKMFFIKSDDENEVHPDRHQRKSFRLSPPHRKHAVTYDDEDDEDDDSLGSITDYDSDFDDEESDEEDLFTHQRQAQVTDAFHKKPPPTMLKHQRSLLSDMLSRKATASDQHSSKSNSRPIPQSSASMRPSPFDPLMAKELSESLCRNVQWEQSQKRLCCFKRHTTPGHPTSKNENLSLTDDEFQGW